MATFALVSNYATNRLSKGTVVLVHATYNGLTLTSGVVWSIEHPALQIFTIAADSHDTCRLTGAYGGTDRLVGTYTDPTSGVVQIAYLACTVIGAVLPAVMTIQPAASGMTVGDQRTFTAYRNGVVATGGITWIASAQLAMQVQPDQSLVVQAMVAGTAAIAVKDNATGANVGVQFTVVAAPVMTIQPAAADLTVGTQRTCTAYRDGVPATTGVEWFATPQLALVVQPDFTVVARGALEGAATLSVRDTVSGVTATEKFNVAAVPQPVQTLTISTNYPSSNMSVGEAIIAKASLNGAVLTSGVTWSVKAPASGAIKIAGDLSNVCRITGMLKGTDAVVATYGTAVGTLVCGVAVAVPTPTPTPVPVPTPVYVPSPAAAWHRHRPHITVGHTDFNYNWDKPHDWLGTVATPMEIAYAARYDFSYSGFWARQQRFKTVNANMHCLPYTLLLTCETVGTAIEGAYLPDFATWCAANAVTAAQAEAALLHLPGFTDAANRLVVTIWGSTRWVGDPTSDAWRRYSADRYRRIAAPAWVDGAFIDEYGSSQNRGMYKLSCPADTVRLQALCDAQTTLLAAVAGAIAPKQLVINTSAYLFPWDAQETDAARGTHMEQINDAVPPELWSQSWPYIDQRLAAGDFVNIVPLRDFGHYETVHDAQTPANYLDTPRGKLVELASYYMLVTDPALLGLSIENGDWSTDTPMQNWLAEIDAEIGLALEPRKLATVAHQGTSGRAFVRRFANGVVVANVCTDRTNTNYGVGNTTTVTLPTDRTYAQVRADGTLAAAAATVTLRCPEAAVFVVV